MIAAAKLNWTDHAKPPSAALRDAIGRYGRVPQVRGIREFAEQEIVIPDGDFAGQMFRVHRQPAHGLWFDEIDSGRWSRFAFVACQQSGKTLAGFVAPIMYHAFELQETVIIGVPTMDLARDKWEVDIKPAIEASRFAQYLPVTGAGSRGGTPELIVLRNGVNLKFMSGGGGDEKRSAFTSRVLVVTEADKLDDVGSGSAEATKLRQMEGRTRFYGNRKRIYLECTVSEEQGTIWQEWMNGSGGLVYQPCESCGEYVAPEREHFIGWQDATEEIDAEAAQFSCPACGILWREASRREQLQQAVVLHRGQAIEDGKVVGDLPRTRTCGFRYSAAANYFADTAMIGVDEWRAARAIDEELASRELLQWTWAWPPQPLVKQVEPLSVEAVEQRQHHLPRGILPSDVVRISAGVDARKEQLDWFVVAERKSGGPLCVDFGYTKLDLLNKTLQQALQDACRQTQERFDYGWQVDGQAGKQSADIVLLDCHWETDALYEACSWHRDWAPALGFGHRQHRASYNAPKKKGAAVKRLGDAWHQVEMSRRFEGINRTFLVCENNADVWKSRVHRALSVEVDHPQALLLPKESKPGTRRELAKQLTAERQESCYVAGKGTQLKWVTKYHLNHWLDAAYMAMVGLSVKQTDVAPRTFSLPGAR
jgi:phage terminase large subunit GpA-like protein